MSSVKKQEATVEVLRLQSSGRGQPKEKPIVRKIREEHGTPIVSFPKFFLELGIKLNAEVTIEKRGSNNMLDWEIIIKPKALKKHSAKAKQ